MPRMKAAVVVEPGRTVLEPREVPDVGPLDTLVAGLGDNEIVTSAHPGRKEHMHRPIAVVASGCVAVRTLVAHRFELDRIDQVYEHFSHQRDGVPEVAISP